MGNRFTAHIREKILTLVVQGARVCAKTLRCCHSERSEESRSEYLQRIALEYYELDLAIAREIGHRRGEGNALWNMSLAPDQLGDRPHAIANAQAALKILVEIEDPSAETVRRKLAEWGA